MPIPKPTENENEQEFISRCMSDETMVDEYENAQRMAICSVAWNEKNVKTMSKYELKAAQEIKDMDSAKREVAVYLAKFGNVDSDNDVIQKGAFKKSLQERGVSSQSNRKIAFLRHHDWEHQIGTFVKLQEDDNGLFAVGRLGTSTKGEDAWRDYQDGIIREHSIGFQRISDKTKFVKDTSNPAGGFTLLQEVKLWEGSAVTFGANELTNVVEIMKSENKKNYIDKISNDLQTVISALINGKGSDERLYELEMKAKFLSNQLTILAQTEPQTHSVKLFEPEPEEFSWKAVFETLETKQTYADYPTQAKENARKGLELNEAVGNKCATAVGKTRANQISKGEGLSLDTLKRTYSYLSRAEVYYDANDTEACGTISYLLWGGKAMLSYCESKLKELNEL
jgi:HK97 family phage prohead protease